MIPAGLSLHVADRIDLFFEGGYLAFWSTGRQSDPTAKDPTPEDRTSNHAGGYGALGVAFTFNP